MQETETNASFSVCLFQNLFQTEKALLPSSYTLPQEENKQLTNNYELQYSCRKFAFYSVQLILMFFVFTLEKYFW